jgi:SAM-dependent methyltransferase
VIFTLLFTGPDTAVPRCGAASNAVDSSHRPPRQAERCPLRANVYAIPFSRSSEKEETMPYGTRAGNIYILATLFLALILLTAAAPAARAQEEQPANYDSLKALYDEAIASKDYEKAVQLGMEAAWVVGEKHTEMLYGIARLHALEGETWKAYFFLQMAVDAGFWNVRRIMQDQSFESLRGTERFKKILKGAWANGYVWVLERDERDDFQKPDEVMEKLAFKPGETVADVGAGTGYFTVRIARAVGPDGRVLAHDISPEMLGFLERRLEAEQLENVELKRVERDDAMLPTGGVNTIIMVDTIHYIKERTAYVKRLREGLAPGGRFVIIDYRVKPFEERPWGPPPEQQIPKEQLNKEIEEAGFERVADHDFLPEQYFMVYEMK